MHQYFYTFEYVLAGLYDPGPEEVHDVPHEVATTTYGVAAMVWVLADKVSFTALV